MKLKCKKVAGLVLKSTCMQDQKKGQRYPAASTEFNEKINKLAMLYLTRGLQLLCHRHLCWCHLHWSRLQCTQPSAQHYATFSTYSISQLESSLNYVLIKKSAGFSLHISFEVSAHSRALSPGPIPSILIYLHAENAVRT